ncbi:MAG: tRNA (adenosine(37)-N6)-threonylcarbamoyltransferase complex ATPase subunit type 1 TsaE [Solirubrobacterales bacterium]
MSEADAKVVSEEEAETARIAAEFAGRLQPGDLILVVGEVGAGKSTFVRSALRELGVEGPIHSPTFTIGRAYRGRLPAFHLDLYRIDLPGEEVPDLLGEYLDPSGVTFVEWPDRPMGNLFDSPHRVGRVEIRHLDGDRREIYLSGPADRN